MKIKKQFTGYFPNKLITFVFDNIINDLFDNIENKIQKNSKIAKDASLFGGLLASVVIGYLGCSVIKKIKNF